MWTFPDGQYRNQIDYISQRWRGFVVAVKRRPGTCYRPWIVNIKN